MLIVKSNPRVNPGVKPLPKIDQEGLAVKRLVGLDTITLEQAGYSNLGRALRSNKITECHLIMHGNAKWYRSRADGTVYAVEYTPGLVTEHGELDPVDPEDFVNLFAPYSVRNGGSLNFIFINACLSSGYGTSLNKAGFRVVFWRTRVPDDVAADFAATFYEERANCNCDQAAFNFAKQKIPANFVPELLL